LRAKKSFRHPRSEGREADFADGRVLRVNTVANYDPDIIPCLQTPPPCSFEKISGTHIYRPLDKA
jgi:hypothetical protein